MSRSLKFRAWDKANNEMFFVRTLTWDREMQLANPVHIEGNLMQYTGLKDSEGKEIYEGDIVEYPIALEFYPKLFINKIIWDDAQWKLSRYSADGYLWSEMKIIGNIYENPELLENKE